MNGSKTRTCICNQVTMSNWSVHEAFVKATKNHSRAHLTSPVIRLYDEHESIPIEAWEDALIKAANLVERWGESYLPIFERVECELENSKQQLRTLEKARSIANGGLAPNKYLLRQQSDFIEP